MQSDAVGPGFVESSSAEPDAVGVGAVEPDAAEPGSMESGSVGPVVLDGEVDGTPAPGDRGSTPAAGGPVVDGPPASPAGG